MRILMLFPYYFRWHYTQAYKDLTRIWKNYMWFFWNLFSIPLLLKTLFTPWKRLIEEKGEYFSFESFFSRIILNSLMRAIGALIRLIFILSAISILCIVFFAGLSAYFLWTLLPFVVFGLVVFGIGSFFI